MSRWREIAQRFLPSTALSLLDSARSGRHPRKRQRNVAVMFVDIEGCTRLCQELSPRQMERVIEAYFARYLDVIREAGGEATEVLGNGLVALFEGPSLRKDSTRALLAALHIQDATRELNARHGARHEPIIVNIGLSAGAELFGITRLRGKSRERSVYRAIGPVTNVAARTTTPPGVGPLGRREGGGP